MLVSKTAERSRVHPAVTAFVDPETNTISYVVVDSATMRAAIVDPVLNLDWAAGRIGHRSVEEIVGFVERNDLTVEWLIETHVHADHLSAARVLKERIGGKIAIGEKITAVQETFGAIFGEGADFARDGRQFDHLFADGETYRIGDMEAVALATPGHTPACMTHVVGDAAFVGDTLFMPDSGTARADFPGGDARTLFQSARRILSLPGETRIFLCHDYGEGGRDLRWETTVAEERAANTHVRDGMDVETYVDLRTKRDATLAMPRLILPSLQVNMKAGALPEPDAADRRFFKVPIDAL